MSSFLSCPHVSHVPIYRMFLISTNSHHGRTQIASSKMCPLAAATKGASFCPTMPDCAIIKGTFFCRWALNQTVGALPSFSPTPFSPSSSPTPFSPSSYITPRQGGGTVPHATIIVNSEGINMRWGDAPVEK